MRLRDLLRSPLMVGVVALAILATCSASSPTTMSLTAFIVVGLSIVFLLPILRMVSEWVAEKLWRFQARVNGKEERVTEEVLRHQARMGDIAINNPNLRSGD